MIINYIKIAIRNIRRHKSYSLINMAGLSVGITCCVLVMLYIQDELRYDRFHTNKDFIYRVIQTEPHGDNAYESPTAPWPLGRALVEKFPEVQASTRFHKGYNARIQLGDNVFKTHHAEVDPGFFEIFTFPFISGDPKTALNDPLSVVVTESFAEKCFDSTDVLGETINFHFTDKKITGVIHDIPHHSHLQFECAILIEQNPDVSSEELWSSRRTTYVRMNQRISLQDFNRKIENIVSEYYPNLSTKVRLQPFDRIYLHSNFLMEEHESEEAASQIRGDIRNIIVLSLAALCLLLIVCINYMNLSTAIAHSRAREIGIRKVCGSQKGDLIRQFLGESLTLAFLSLLCAFLLVWLILPIFNQISGKSLELQGFLDPPILIGTLLTALLTGILSGVYPAFYLSSINSADVLRNRLSMKKSGRLSLRQVLVVFQFAAAIVIIIGAAVFGKQTHYILAQYKGFDVDNTLILHDWTFASHHENVKAELLQHPDIMSVTQSVGPGYNAGASKDVDWDGKDPEEKPTFYYSRIDYDFAEVLNAELVAGRFFSKEQVGDNLNFILNQTAVKLTGLSSPIGQRFSMNGIEGQIIGVFKDRHFGSLKYPIRPKVFRIDQDHPRFMVKVKETGDIPEILAYINGIRKKFPDYSPVSYRFAEDDIALYSIREQKLSRIFTWVTFLTLFLACLGLLGLSAFYVAQKTKEIGIRKILGSSVPEIVTLLTREFIKWVLIAGFIAAPIAYIIMERFLQDYVYRVRLGFEIFLVSVIAALVIATLTVSFQAVKAAMANPVDALRSE
jgi:putative ABC transport system permease protein